MAARRQLTDGEGFVACFILVLIVGFIIKYIWWVVGAGALVGLFFVGRVVAREVQKRRELAEKREFELRRRADRQHRWMLSGDPRAIYGEQGAAAMRKVAPSPEGDEPVATMATTTAELTALERDKPQAWEWALFTSILLQRRAPLLPRLRDSELGFTPGGGIRVHTGSEFARTLMRLIDEMLTSASQLDSFMAAPAFMAPFHTSDAEAIKHVANRVMDYHERLLEISERCRELSVPSQYADVLADCARLLDVPLQSYREFIAELADVIESLPQVLEHATGVVNMGSVVMDLDLDEVQEGSRLLRRLEAISKS
ncbi:Uncharacterised protein [Mycolicibacterium vanbaalenii]|uniref:Uncharacterized protein n=1 Tax=Mycolicibacterium vanbaalenii TaxID=110539 RepID=A0A5S9R9T0_MYCVN|nr:hypothetical protein [Mycolicibacterium vanbaalenii]CAA0138293.1 Uncharacterised protein [Mycolicibacterium vanbaalenii]